MAVKILRWIFKAQAAQKEYKSFYRAAAQGFKAKKRNQWLGFKAKKRQQMATQQKAEPTDKKLS